MQMKKRNNHKSTASDTESTGSTRSSSSSSSQLHRVKQDKQNQGEDAQFKLFVVRVKSLMETAEVQVIMIILIALDIGCTALEIHLKNHQQLAALKNITGDEVVTSLFIRVMTRLVESFTGFTLVFFVIELGVLVVALRIKFFAHAGYVLDLGIVSISLIVEMYAQTKAARLLGIFRVWRVLQFMRWLVNQERAAHDSTRLLLEQEQLKLLDVQVQKNAARESLEREYESRAGLEQLLREYKDEILTLKEALQIAAETVAEATSSQMQEYVEQDADFVSNEEEHHSMRMVPENDLEKQYWNDYDENHQLETVHPVEMKATRKEWQRTEQQADVNEIKAELAQYETKSDNEFEDAVTE